MKHGNEYYTKTELQDATIETFDRQRLSAEAAIESMLELLVRQPAIAAKFKTLETVLHDLESAWVLVHKQ